MIAFEVYACFQPMRVRCYNCLNVGFFFFVCFVLDVVFVGWWLGGSNIYHNYFWH